MKFVWGHFKNAAGLIWLLEALGANDDMINKAFEAGSDVAAKGEIHAKQCAKIREVISWEDVKQLLIEKKFRRPMK